MTGVEGDECRIAIWQLQQTLTANRLPAEVAESEPVLVVTGNPDEGTRSLTVRCDPRPTDGDRLWFWMTDPPPRPDHPWDYDATPLGEADRLADAMVRVLDERQIRR